jgi:cytochrome c
MDSFEFNKIAGAILATCLFLVALSLAAEAIYAPPRPAKPGYEIEIPKAGASGETAKAAPEEPFEKLLASGTVERGQASAKVCLTCHTFDKGGPNKVGPNLWGIVGRPRGSEAGFNYSAAMKAKTGDWTLDDLNKFLESPKGYVPGTAMSFGGFPKPSQRADVIDYLNSLSDNPKPLPVVKQ